MERTAAYCHLHRSAKHTANGTSCGSAVAVVKGHCTLIASCRAARLPIPPVRTPESLWFQTARWSRDTADWLGRYRDWRRLGHTYRLARKYSWPHPFRIQKDFGVFIVTRRTRTMMRMLLIIDPGSSAIRKLSRRSGKSRGHSVGVTRGPWSMCSNPRSGLAQFRNCRPNTRPGSIRPSVQSTPLGSSLNKKSRLLAIKSYSSRQRFGKPPRVPSSVSGKEQSRFGKFESSLTNSKR